MAAEQQTPKSDGLEGFTAVDDPQETSLVQCTRSQNG
jgi:hypothetical protein